MSKLSALLRCERSPTGTEIITENRPGEIAYIILEGSVKVHAGQLGDSDVILAILGAGEVVGEMSLADSLHEKVQAATEFIAETNRRVILPYEVFAEAINIFGKKVGRREAARAGKAHLARHVSGDLRIVPSSETILAAALDRLQSAQGEDPCFIDCLVMSSADLDQTQEIFGFDETFRKNGYRLPETPKRPQAA